MSALKTFVKKYIGASWNNPLINAAARLMDLPDKIVRKKGGLEQLPRFSGRIRSNGFIGQFGGKRFAYYGKLLGNTLIDECQLKPSDKVMEIGCGVGRTAVFLSSYLNDGNYFGWDVDPVSIDIDNKLPLFKKKKFRFQCVNFKNDLYNKKGEQIPFRFPAEDNSYNVVFLVSVFTHMYPQDITFYIKEISRVLKPGGHCMFTCFLMDYGVHPEMNFKFKRDGYYINNEKHPLQTIAFDEKFFTTLFEENHLKVKNLLKGNWRSKENGYRPQTEFKQDIFIVSSEK
jgi:SAM-dependent methyltransferase